MTRRRAFDICLTVLITAGFILLGALVFQKSYLRISECFYDLFVSVKFYFCEIFGIKHSIVPTVTEPSSVMKLSLFLPLDFDGFVASSKAFFALLFDGENFREWCAHAGVVAGSFGKVIAVVLPCILLLAVAVRAVYSSHNTKHNKDTLPLVIFKRVSAVTYQPLKRAATEHAEFLREHRWIVALWIAIWVFNLNLASIAVSALAYYFFFAVSFDFGTFYTQACKLVADLQVIFADFPWWCAAPFLWVIFDRFRKRIALMRLRHFEARNCGFINELPIVSMTCGSMGRKKTTMITDMVLSQEVMFRQRAFEILRDTDMKLPYFPWIAFEDELRACMEHGTVHNLATVKKWVALKRDRYTRNCNADTQLYGYDIARYGGEFNDALKVSGLFEVLETYALAYFVYVTESSLIVSNYSVREDNEISSSGNFPVWRTDFFPEGITEGRHAHILDFDALRLGKKVIENNPHSGSFEFGVVAITEVGKERGNNLELKEVKKSTRETNQKNDLFNSWLKMCRHSATVDNFPFIKVFTDEQRPESWGADARDLCEILHIVSAGEQRLALPFYTIEDALSRWLFERFVSLYYDFRFRRGDNTLLVHILKSLVAVLWRRNLRVYNRFGYSVLKIEKERGTMDGKIEKKRYYLMSKKIYSRRFSTDCFSDYFDDMARQAPVGLDGYLEYATEKASVEELKSQHSYFIDSLYRDGDDGQGGRSV